MASPKSVPAPTTSIPDPDFAVSAAAHQSSSFWERISTWASENKAVVYTIAGVAVVVTGAGVAYYLTDSVRAITAMQFLSM
jgi:import receptor subunit TOM70